MRKSSKKFLFQEEGMATLMVIFFSSILALLAAHIFRLSRESDLSSYKDLLFFNTVEIVKGNLYNYGENSAAWKATVTYNKTLGRMTCVESGGNCALSYETISLVNPDGSVYYNPSTQGFTQKGAVCNYNSTTVTSGCIMQVTVQWSPFCDVPCQVPSNKVIFKLSFSTPYNAASPVDPRAFMINSTQLSGAFPSMNVYR